MNKILVIEPTPRLIDLQLFGETEEGTPDQTDNTTGSDNQPETEIEYDTIDYNKEEVKIPVSERKTYLQKGYNYDKVYEDREATKAELEALKNAPELKFMKSFLEQNGYENMNAYETDLRAKEIMKEEGLSRDHALAVLRDRDQQLKDSNNEKIAEKTRADEAKQTEMIQSFLKNFPDADTDNLPQAVVEMVQDGIDLSIAYELNNLRQGTDRTKIEQEVLNQLDSNANTSSGSVTKGNADHKTSYSSMSKDDFNQLVENVKRGNN